MFVCLVSFPLLLVFNDLSVKYSCGTKKKKKKERKVSGECRNIYLFYVSLMTVVVLGNTNKAEQNRNKLPHFSDCDISHVVFCDQELLVNVLSLVVLPRVSNVTNAKMSRGRELRDAYSW